MEATIIIDDRVINSIVNDMIEKKISELNIDLLINKRIDARVDSIINSKLSFEKIDNFAKDRVSRILTTENLKDYTFGITESDVLSNLESKILLMIERSTNFKKLVISVLKNSL